MKEVRDRIVAMLDQAVVTRDSVAEEGGDVSLAQEQMDRTRSILDSYDAGEDWRCLLDSLIAWQTKVGLDG